MIPLLLFVAVGALLGVHWKTRAPTNNLTKLTPPEIYKSWWVANLKCVNVDLNMNDCIVSWWTCDKEMVLKDMTDVGSKVGLYFADEKKVALTKSYVLDERVVRHEMMHAICDKLGVKDGATGHPTKYFVDCFNLMPH